MIALRENKVNEELAKVKSSYQKRLDNVHTGRPRPSMLENIQVEIYGQTMELKGLTTIELLDGKFRLQPWDPSARKAIDAAIRSSNLGLSPDVKEDAIYVSVPPLTEETRKKKVAEVGTYLEDARVATRKVRHDFINELKGLDGVSEDVEKSDEKSLQIIIDKFNKELEEMAKAKEAEILKI